MSSIAPQNRLDVLLTRADEAIKTNALRKAAEALREASHLDAENPRVQEFWTTLQKLEGGSDALKPLRSYVDGNDSGDGEKALHLLKQAPLSPVEAEQAVNLLIHSGTALGLLDTLTGTLLDRNVSARKALAKHFSTDATEIFNLLFDRGPDSFKGLASIPLESALWTVDDVQSTAQRDMFRLCVAKLIDAGVEHEDMLMRSIARLVSQAAENVANIVDTEVMDAILSSLDIRLDASLRSQAMLATSKILEATQARGEEMFSGFIHDRVAKQTNDDLIVAFSAASSAFPIIPAVAAKLFLTDGFVQQLVPNLERNWQEGAEGKRKSLTLETAALELLSAACVDKTCRTAIQRYCLHWLQNLTDEREGTHKALAALVLAKISEESSSEMTEKLGRMVLNGDKESIQAIEGLAYTTLQGKVKEEIAGNDKLIKQLISALNKPQVAIFGCLTVFANLTAYRPNLTEEQKKMSQLKAYANSQKPAPEDPLDDNEHVTARCKKLVDADVIPGLVACCKQTTSPTNVALIVSILLALSKEQKHRPRMSSQGAVKLLLQIRDRIAKTDKSTTEAASIERQAAHALARLLISVNPAHIFSSSFPASNAVSALVPLLWLDQDSEQRDLLPTFEALLALTNLASMNDDGVRELQLRLLWSQLEDHLLLSSNKLVQRASAELICNLMASPTCVAKFVGDGSKREATRLQILLALGDVEDLGTRRAAGGALAMLTEWDAAVSSILDMTGDKGVKALLAMCADESDEIKHRGFVCVTNVINAPDAVGRKGAQRIKEIGGMEILKGALTKVKNQSIMSIGIEVLKKLT